MDAVSIDLSAALVSAFGPYLQGVVAARGWPAVPTEVVHAAEGWLRTALDQTLSQPFREQRRGPLELFQEAMSGPTEALVAAGVVPPRRDPAAIAALPGDTYDLSPASSAALGEEALRVHLAWGAAKAAAVTRPECGVLAANLLDVGRIEHAVAARGYRFERVRGSGDIDNQAVVFVDLQHSEADAVMRAAATHGMRLIAFGPHVDEFALTRARLLGAADAVPRSRFFADPGAFLPKYL